MAPYHLPRRKLSQLKPGHTSTKRCTVKCIIWQVDLGCYSTSSWVSLLPPERLWSLGFYLPPYLAFTSSCLLLLLATWSTSFCHMPGTCWVLYWPDLNRYNIRKLFTAYFSICWGNLLPFDGLKCLTEDLKQRKLASSGCHRKQQRRDGHRTYFFFIYEKYVMPSLGTS